MNPKISVIIPTYNRANLLPRAIKSVLSQTFKDFELIIVDDGSNDNTKRIVEEFQKRDSRVKYIWQKNSGGAASPKNNGIKNTQGNYIAILDSDDEWLPEKLQKQLELFENSSNQKKGFVSCHALVINEKSGKKFEYKTPRYKNVLKNILTQDYMGSGSGMLYKKSVFDNVGLFDENLKTGQDWEMRIRLAQKYDFDFVPEPLFKYYWYEENITRTVGNLKKVQDYEYILIKHKNLYKKYPKAYSIRLRNIGSLYLLNNNLKKARKYFVKAIKIAPWYLRSYFNLIISLLGVKFYRRILFRKRKIAGDFSLDQSYKL